MLKQQAFRVLADMVWFSPETWTLTLEKTGFNNSNILSEMNEPSDPESISALVGKRTPLEEMDIIAVPSRTCLSREEKRARTFWWPADVDGVEAVGCATLWTPRLELLGVTSSLWSRVWCLLLHLKQLNLHLQSCTLWLGPKQFEQRRNWLMILHRSATGVARNFGHFLI